MNYRLARPSRAPRSRRTAARVMPVSPAISWVHDGVRHRVTVWPDVSFEREVAPDEWVSGEPGEGALASSALGITANQWRRYLEFVPAAEREFVTKFQFGRLAALHVITQCPALLDELTQVPALVPFLTAHRGLRGDERTRWSEIAAVFEREGIFGVLQWLGLPATRQARTILGNIADPDLPRRLLEPLRAALWDPETIWALSRSAALTDERLAVACHALAA